MPAKTRGRLVADQMRGKLPKPATLTDTAEEDVLADMTLPRPHRAKLHSTNPIERLNGEIRRRTDVVAIFPDEPSIRRLAAAILMEQTEERTVRRGRYMTLETLAPVCDDLPVGLPAAQGDRPARPARVREARHELHHPMGRDPGQPASRPRRRRRRSVAWRAGSLPPGAQS